LTDVERVDASELWEAMRETHIPFALIDPATHLFVDANEEYAALFDCSTSELKGVSVMSLYGPEIGESIEALHGAFMRGALQAVRGQGSFQTPDGKAIELKGWSRRIEGMSDHPLVVTSAVDMASETTLPDDRFWVDQAPHLFGLSEDPSGATTDNASRRADQLEQHMWRIANEVRTAGFMPVLGETFSLASIKEFSELTTRQREIVARLAAGERVKEIAREMYLSPSTVRNHLTAVFRRFGVHSQLELISVLRNM
jgi:DNA-binding CsgD family transcriptional regulator